MNYAKRIQRDGRRERQRAHINKTVGSRPDAGIFLPQRRMNQIRWEQSIMHSIARREGVTVTTTRRFDCSCGSIGCLGNIIDSTLRRRRKERQKAK